MFPDIPALLRAGLQEPVDLSVAMGHGRSWGNWSRFLWRDLPGINQCGVWAHLSHSTDTGRSPLVAIADIGNDLAYGVPAVLLLQWLDICLSRLVSFGCEIAMLSLPMDSLGRMTPVRFALARRLLFPRHPVSWEKLRHEIDRLDTGLRNLANRYGVSWVEAQGEWYGWDTIHIRRDHRIAAWSELFGRWRGWSGGPLPDPSNLRETLHLKGLRPAECVILGHRWLTPQPSLNSEDLRLFLY